MTIETSTAIVGRLWDDVWNPANQWDADAIFDEDHAAPEKRAVPRIRTAVPA